MPTTIWDGCVARPGTVTAYSKEDWWSLEKKINNETAWIQEKVYKMYSVDACQVREEENFWTTSGYVKGTTTLTNQLLSRYITQADIDAA